MENDRAYIDKAVEQFRELLVQQIAREERMRDASGDGSVTERKVTTIGVIPGDGIGPVITKQAVRILQALLIEEIKAGSIVLKDIEGLTIDERLACGQSVPAQVMDSIKSCDVLLKGPTETPKGGTMESANVTLRRELDLFSNVRPVSVPEEGIDWTFFRENTEGEYVLGSRGIEIPGKLAMDFKVTTDHGTARIAKAAFEFAANNGKKHVSIVTKANIMKKTDGKFSQICHEIAALYPDITVEDYYIDIMTAKLINKDERSRFSVFILPNLYGDIITDEAAQIQGGVGTAGSANIGAHYAMFEAVHGTAPQLVREGLAMYANPLSIIKASEMMLRHIGLCDKADRLYAAIEAVTCTEGKTAVQIADMILERL